MQVRVCWLYFVIFYLLSEVSLGSLKVTFLRRTHICCIPAYLSALCAYQEESKTDPCLFFFFLIISLIYGLKILQICNLINSTLVRCYT